MPEPKRRGRPPPPEARRPRPEGGGAPPASLGAQTSGPAVAAEAEEPERLQRVLARAGFGSRRAVEDLIRDGRVRVGSRVAVLGDRVDAAREAVSVDGVPVPVHPGLRYLALNKPSGVTTTMRDPHALETVASLIPEGPRVFPVGRLDRASEGLLLLTNDGDLSHRLQHPRFEVEKEYLVEASGRARGNLQRRLVEGVELYDGLARARRVSGVERLPDRLSLRIVMTEGRKREVRRLFAALGMSVTRLVRVRLGPVRLGRLAPGEVRPLDREEVEGLYRMTGLQRARPGRRSAKQPT